MSFGLACGHTDDRKTSPGMRGRCIMKPITTCLWFDTEGEEAATLYTSLIENSRILDTTHYGEAGPRAAERS